MIETKDGLSREPGWVRTMNSLIRGTDRMLKIMKRSQSEESRQTHSKLKFSLKCLAVIRKPCNAVDGRLAWENFITMSYSMSLFTPWKLHKMSSLLTCGWNKWNKTSRNRRSTQCCWLTCVLCTLNSLRTEQILWNFIFRTSGNPAAIMASLYINTGFSWQVGSGLCCLQFFQCLIVGIWINNCRFNVILYPGLIINTQ